MKYYFTTEKRVDYNAGTKAVNDTNQILDGLGYKPLKLGTFRRDKSWRCLKLKELSDLFILLFCKSSNDIYFLQWPFYHLIQFKLILWCIKIKCKHLQILIHDINSLRGLDCHMGKDDDEISIFRHAELLIVHTEKMKEYIVSCGIDSNKIKVLTSFDYLTNDSINSVTINSNTLIYAGNLLKSSFLNEIKKSHNIILNCYGKEMPYSSPHLIYKGAFQAENVSKLEGSWGLVWDGISTSSCKGDFGNYMQYNSPHKLSLYIAAGFPIIIWNKSGLAEYITLNNLGIVVNSIDDIYYAINQITEEQYQTMIENVKKESIKLRSGSHLKKYLV